MANVTDRAPRVEPGSRAEWREWLTQNHAASSGAWAVISKPRASRKTVTYEEAVEEALCFGWIDGRIGRLDDDRMLQWFAPRRPRSTWARTNKERVERLEAAGLMTDAGRAVIAIAKSNGSWDSLNDMDALLLPPELEAGLAVHDGAREHFDSQTPTARRTALYYISGVKRPDLRAGRVAQIVEVCVNREPLSHAWQPHG